MNKFVNMYCNIWTTRPPGECWKTLHQPEVICTRLGRALSIHPRNLDNTELALEFYLYW